MLENCYNNDLSSNEDINYQKPTKHLVLPSQSYEYQNPSKFITEGKFVKNFTEDPLFSIQNFSPLYKEGKPIVIGTGTFSTVFLYKNNYSNKYYAVKYMKKKKIIETCATLESVYKEISIQSKITHENIVKLYSSNEKEKDFSLVMEYVPGGNLFKKIHKQKGLNEDDAFKYFIQVCNAIYFLHKNDIIHRDIKPENLLLNSEGTKVKLCDFGWCCEVEIGNRKTFCGTFEYMAPEIIKEEPYNKSIDIWALGVLLYEMLYGYSPFHAQEKTEDKATEVLKNILSKKITFPLDKQISKPCIDLIRKMVEPNINERINIRDVLKSEFVQQYEYKMFGEIDVSNYESAPVSLFPVRHSETNYMKYKNVDNKKIEKKNKDDEQFFNHVLDKVQQKHKKIKRGSSVPPKEKKKGVPANNSGIDVVDLTIQPIFKQKNIQNVNPSQYLLDSKQSTKNLNLNNKSSVISIDSIDNNNKKENNEQNKEKKEENKTDKFLKQLNRESEDNEYHPRLSKPRKSNVSSISNKKKNTFNLNLTNESLKDAINLVEISKNEEKEVNPFKETKEEKEPETFWQKLFKNFKCD